MRRDYDEFDLINLKELGHKNEPGDDFFLSVNTRTYPDMFSSYKMFASLVNKSTKEIILGNGFENVMKNVLLSLKPQTLGWSKPAWGMLDIYCEALSIKPINNYFKYDGKINQIPLTDKVDVYYTTYNYNNLFQHENIDLNIVNSNYNIIDISYLSLEEMKDVISKLSNKKNIIIGSFDKMYGCGIRFGFAIFDKEMFNSMSLQREQYINSLAEKLLQTLPIINYQWFSKIEKMCLPKGYMLTHNYLTLPFDYKGKEQCKKFQIDGKQFTRFAIPHDLDSFNKLKDVINELERM